MAVSRAIHFAIFLLPVTFVVADLAAPTNVRITEITCTTATVVWDVVDDATGYRVDYELINRRTNSHTGSAWTRSGLNPPNSCTLEQLRSSSEYSVIVTSLENGGTSPPVTFTTCDNSNSNINVPTPTVSVTAPNTQTVGQSLTLQCEVTTMRGITSRVDIVWSSNGTVLRRINGIIATTMDHSLVYTDSYTISQLSTTDDGRVIHCEVMINTTPSVMANNNITLDATVPTPTVTISTSGPIQGAMVGSPQVINCTVNTVSGVESSSVMISWIRPGGESITNDSRVTISPTTSRGNDYTSSLRFTYLMKGDEGTYTCNVVILKTGTSQSVDLQSLIRISVPTTVQVSEVTDSSALISWDGVDNVNEYRVQWRLLNENVTMTTDVTGGITNITLNNLLPNRQYGVTVSNLSVGVLVNTSAEVPFTTSPTSVTQSTDSMVTCNGILLVAPMKLTVQIVSHQMLMMSWNYPSSLLAQTMFEVTYSLVSAYNTSVGMRTFAESDVINTTETSFHFALISSVTNYIFTVTPYSATRAGDSARVLADDFSGVDLEDPVVFFNLRLSDTSNNPSYSSSQADIDKTNLDLTRLMQSSIEDTCQCTLPSYTLRGSMDLCDSQTNCAIYTGRLLGSDTASATEVFKMVEDWLATQNGSLLNGELSIDPDCPLRRFSPSDPACSTPNNSPPSDDDDDGNDNDDETMMLIIILASLLVTVIICSIIIICVMCACRSRKTKKEDPLSSSIYAQPLVRGDNERHYSVIVHDNPSYNRCHGNNVRTQQNSVELQNIMVTNGNSHADQPSGMNTYQQQVTQSIHTMVRPNTFTSSGYVECHTSSSTEYRNENENGIPKPTPSYLSIVHTE